MIKRIVIALVLMLTVGELCAQERTTAIKLIAHYVTHKTPSVLAFAFEKKNLINLSQYEKDEKRGEAMKKLYFMGTLALKKPDEKVMEEFTTGIQQVQSEGFKRVETSQFPDAPSSAVIHVKYGADESTISEVTIYNSTPKETAWLYMYGKLTKEDVGLLCTEKKKKK